ncbi:arginine deiminase family protein [Aquimarina addita]|uniref:arginine deiminase n=1 Tax=Aquimarina addita TaxID=870485 RepID=A0ABP7XDR1_9FLAO
MKLNIKNETSRLRAVILGSAVSNGPVPRIEEAYDPKSIEHIKAGTYPLESDMILEMEAVAKVLKKYNVTVYRPEEIQEYNQIFARDIALVIEDKFIQSNILPRREKEIKAIQYVIDQIPSENVFKAPSEEIHFEGGDIIVHNDHIFIGTYKGEGYSNCIVARTNMKGVDYIKSLFPNKIVKEFDLNKSMENARDNALHLDCCFQPVGSNMAIIHKEGFRDVEDYQYLVDFFGYENLFHIDKEEMYQMNSNIFSIAEDIVISEQNFTRLNTWLRSLGMKVEEVPYAQIAKQEGLLRCSTMPLIRDK